MSLSFRIGDLLPAERTAPGPLFATEWSRRTGPGGATAARRTRRTAVSRPCLPRHADARTTTFEDRTARGGRAKGWALDDQLIEPGLVAVSVPVRDPRTGRVACVASVVSHTSRHTAESPARRLLPRLRAAVARDGTGAAPARPPAEPPGPPPVRARRLDRRVEAGTGPGVHRVAGPGADRHHVVRRGAGRADPHRGRPGHRARSGDGPARADHPRTPRVRRRRTTVSSASRPGSWAWASRPCPDATLPRIAAPHLAELSARVHDSASLAVLTEGGDEIQYTARVATSRIMSVNITLGTRLPAYATSLGRVMLADLPPAERLPARSVSSALTPHTVTDPAGTRWPSWSACGVPGTPSSTRSWRRACGPSPCRCGSGAGGSWPR